MDWHERQRERIAAAVTLRDRSPESEKQQLSHRIAGLKAALSKGPEKLRAAARKAQKNRVGTPRCS
jgi:hypothetical protein